MKQIHTPEKGTGFRLAAAEYQRIQAGFGNDEQIRIPTLRGGSFRIPEGTLFILVQKSKA